jgi:quercetin dioxygenase-like cupin family protein
MRLYKLKDMKGGWFVGDFEPSLLKTEAVEVAVKTYKSGDYESAHYHKIAVELTVVVSGEVEMNGEIYKAGDIIVIEPGESTDFRAITDAVNTVVKIPGAKDDKYLLEGN